jgi:hypothetical protein
MPWRSASSRTSRVQAARESMSACGHLVPALAIHAAVGLVEQLEGLRGVLHRGLRLGNARCKQQHSEKDLNSVQLHPVFVSAEIVPAILWARCGTNKAAVTIAAASYTGLARMPSLSSACVLQRAGTSPAPRLSA